MEVMDGETDKAKGTEMEEEEESDTEDQETRQKVQNEDLPQALMKAFRHVNEHRLQDGRWADDEIINWAIP
jgi:hypothetical protein